MRFRFNMINITLIPIFPSIICMTVAAQTQDFCFQRLVKILITCKSGIMRKVKMIFFINKHFCKAKDFNYIFASFIHINSLSCVMIPSNDMQITVHLFDKLFVCGQRFSSTQTEVSQYVDIIPGLHQRIMLINQHLVHFFNGRTSTWFIKKLFIMIQMANASQK